MPDGHAYFINLVLRYGFSSLHFSKGWVSLTGSISQPQFDVFNSSARTTAAKCRSQSCPPPAGRSARRPLWPRCLAHPPAPRQVESLRAGAPCPDVLTQSTAVRPAGVRSRSQPLLAAVEPHRGGSVLIVSLPLPGRGAMRAAGLHRVPWAELILQLHSLLATSK